MILFLILIIFQLIFDKIAGRFEKKLHYLSSVIGKSAILLTVICLFMSIIPSNYKWVSNKKFEVSEVTSSKDFWISTSTDSAQYLEIKKDKVIHVVCDRYLKKSFIEATGYQKVSKSEVLYYLNLGVSYFKSYKLYLTTSDYKKYTEENKK